MDYDEYWQKWLSLFVEEIVKKNSANSERGQPRVPIDQNVGYISQEIIGFGE
ncbi:MAG: hypothetical protein ACM3JQ_01805 [Candidatus Eiseniibacteriota bacterium]